MWFKKFSTVKYIYDNKQNVLTKYFLDDFLKSSQVQVGKLHTATSLFFFSETLPETTYTHFNCKIFLNLQTLIFTFFSSASFFLFWNIILKENFRFLGSQTSLGLDIQNSGLAWETLLPSNLCFMRSSFFSKLFDF